MLDDLHFLIFQNKTRHSPSYVTDKNRIKNSLVLFYHKNKGKVISLPPQCPCIFYLFIGNMLCLFVIVVIQGLGVKDFAFRCCQKVQVIRFLRFQYRIDRCRSGICNRPWRQPLVLIRIIRGFHLKVFIIHPALM